MIIINNLEVRNVSTHFGKALRKLRKKNNLTLKELAQALSMSTASICNLEKGNQHPQLYLVWKICSLFKCPIDSFIPPLAEVTISTTEEVKVIRKTYSFTKDEGNVK